jgi:uncharacterized protein (TIGR02246 family)
MRGIFVPIAALAVVTSTGALAGQGSDESSIKAVIDGFQASWNTPGMPGFEKLFMPDADFVVITGKWLRGRDEIVSYHRDLLKTLYAGSHQFIDQVTVRFVDTQNAVAHVAWGAEFTADGKQVRRTALGTVTLRNDGGRWMIQTVHNTLTGGPGYNFGNPAPPPK